MSRDGSDWDFINEELGGWNNEGLPNFMNAPYFNEYDDSRLYEYQIQGERYKQLDKYKNLCRHIKKNCTNINNKLSLQGKMELVISHIHRKAEIILNLENGSSSVLKYSPITPEIINTYLLIGIAYKTNIPLEKIIPKGNNNEINSKINNQRIISLLQKI